MAEKKQGTDFGELLQELPLDRLKQGFQDLLTVGLDRATGVVTEKVEDVTQRLNDSAENGGAGITAALTGGKALAEGKSPVKALFKGGLAGLAKGALGLGGGSGSSGSSKVINIIEQNDIGLPLRVVYNQWTEYEDFPTMTRKVLSADRTSDEKMNWKAQIFLSKRSWESTIIEQVPDDRIVWTSTGSKGSVDGTVTFHELGPRLTRVLLVLEYFPQGFFEKTANLWRAQGRRARLDFKHIKRHMMRRTILNPDDVEGWRGEVRDREVVKTHEEALQEEQERDAEAGEPESTEGEGRVAAQSGDGEYDEDEFDDEEREDHEDEYDEDEDSEDDEDYGDEDYEAEDEDEEEEEEEEEEARPRRARAGAGRR
ncbi:MAG: SRPBCC family protein [Micromonosporaceae bacterium]